MNNKRVIRYIAYFSFFTIHFSFAQQDSSGFTDKAEAKNLKVNGLKEGKWVEYKNGLNETVTDTNYINYKLTVYKADKPYGIERWYYKSNRLWVETPYTDGKPNGIQTFFYEDGKVKVVFLCKDGKHEGLAKQYYESGKLLGEAPYSDNKINGVVKAYWESGRLKYECTYVDSKPGVAQHYDEAGNEIK